MQLGQDQDYPTVGTLTAVIAHSQIVVEASARSAPRLPAGFDDVDLAVLDWIAAEGRRLGRSLLPI
jgi:hypothetical protein